jgi:hypothetical protein
LLNISWTLHNVVAWLKNKPFLGKKASMFYIGTVILVQPYWILEIAANFVSPMSFAVDQALRQASAGDNRPLADPPRMAVVFWRSIQDFRLHSTVGGPLP